jgi:acyl transferase domain-containing protein/acyl carrier protein
MTASSQEPIAILGAGCRFPGNISNLEALWDALVARVDAITDIPANRWNIDRFYSATKTARGKMYIAKGGFLAQPLDEMDAGFFGISPREAEALDPQQRLLLEVAWEAMENAGFDVRALAGSRTGVFIGGFTLDHMLSQMGAVSREEIGQHTAVGSTMTMLSNRLSHAFDFRGPSMTMDTACSSSLVALHQACQALWTGQCNAALAGGVNVMLRPEMPIAMCKGGFLAADSHCKSFDARADGYARGEGAGIVVLKRLSDAIRDEDPVLAVIHATGVNQDGRTNGITVPNGASQEALMREVCAAAGLEPRQIAYVEAHGTGTPVGDPIEAAAIGAVYGAGRSSGEAPCVIGSVKSNIGHLEAASGMAGLMKSILCLIHNAIPPLGTLETPNPAIPFDRLGLRLADRMLPLGDPDEARVVGINSFGYGGTNAHILLGSAPQRDIPWLDGTAAPEPTEVSAPMLAMSAESDAGLRAVAQGFADMLADPNGPALQDVIYSAGGRRTHLTYRLAVTGADRQAILGKLRMFLDGSQSAGQDSVVHLGKAPAHRGRGTVFVFTGMGPQWWAMGQTLYRTEPVYRQAADEIDEVFRSVSGFSILDEMLRPEAESRITETRFAQPANFLLQAALTQLLASVGIVPDAIVGHSVGEVSSAYAAGVLTLREAALVSFHRSRLQATTAGTGKMLAVGLSDEIVAPMLDGYAGRVSIAAINSPSSVTLAGNAECLAELAEVFTGEGVFNKMLDVEVPYHSPMMDPLRDELLACLAELRPLPPALPLYSTVTGDQVTGIAYDAPYWHENVRQPVYFAAAVRALIRDGFTTFLEVGPHPVLSASLRELFSEARIEGQAIETLRRLKPEGQNLAATSVALFMAGAKINWRARCADATYAQLPNYPWQREKLWTEAREAREDRLTGLGDTLLGNRMGTSLPAWRTEFTENNTPWLPDHRIDDLVVVPAAAYLETFLRLHEETIGGTAAVLRRVSFSQALIAQETTPTVMFSEYDPDGRSARLVSRNGGDRTSFAVHAQTLFYSHDEAAPESRDLAGIRAALPASLTPGDLYADLAARGLNYGPRFQTITALHRGDGEVLARIEATAAFADEPLAYRIHPTLLDGCFQALIAAIGSGTEQPGFVPVGIQELRLNRDFPATVWCHGRVTELSARFVRCDFAVCDEQGMVIAEITGLNCQAIASSAIDAAGAHLASRGYEYLWEEQAATGHASRTGRWLLIGDQDEMADELSLSLRLLGVSDVLSVPAGTSLAEIDGRVIVTPSDPDGAPVPRILSGIDGIVLIPDMGQSAAQDPTGVNPGLDILAVLQALSRIKAVSPRVYVVTRGAHQVTAQDHDIDPAAATLIGLTRVAFNELGDLRCSSIDLGVVSHAGEAAMLATELTADNVEEEVALREAGRFVSRLARSSLLSAPAIIDIAMGGDAAFTLAAPPKRGDAPVFDQIIPPVPGQGEILVRVHAAAASPRARSGGGETDARSPATLLLGEVVASAADTPLRPGCFVAGYAAAALASHAIMRGEAAIPVALPPGMTAATAAATLDQRARARLAAETAGIGPDSTVLAYADTTGIAVILAAMARGATVIAMNAPGLAGEASRFGANAVVSSTADMTAAVRRLTGGAGVTVLAAPLASWALTRDFSMLAEGGFLLDTAAEPSTPRLPDGNGVGAVMNMASAVTASHARSALLRHLADAAAQLAADPIAVTPQPSVLAGDLGMAPSGAAVILHDPDASVTARRLEMLPVNGEGTYLITGGFGGFGTEVARWLVRNGARHLALIGRRGAAGAEAMALVRELEDAGARIAALACDIGDAENLRAALAELARTMPPVRGVIHSAAVLVDAPLVELTKRDFRRVMSAKALGAWNLHTETAGLPLDFFVLFSSISCLVGNSGQTNYAAANSYLDALAAHRRSLGLPGTSVNWGAIADVGLVSRSAMLQKHLEYTGLVGMPVADALAALGAVMAKDLTRFCYAEVDWPQWGRHEPMGGKSRRFIDLVGTGDEGAEGSAADRFRRQMAELVPADRQSVLAYTFAEIFSPELRLPAESIDINRPFNRLGIDSLMAVGLQLSVEAAVGVRVSAFELVGDGSLFELAQKCLLQMDLPAAEMKAA